MPTTLTNGIQLPDKGSVDWYNSMQSNYNLIDTHLGNTDIHVTAEDKANWDSKQGSLSQAQLDAIAQVATNTSDIATLQSGKANASHTHSSSDITDIGDYATKQYVDNSISGLVDNAPAALNTLNELSAALNDDSNFASTVTTALSAKANSADLATVATSGSYNDLSNKPTINDSTITIQKNGSLVGTFTVNGSAKTIDIPVPTKTSDLTNDSNFVDTSNSAVASGITSAKVTSYDSHVADTDIHVTTADKTKWNNGVSQSYVLRYSSSSVTDNSTIAYSTLDNTDNIKSGDKVIDSDGKIFSIVSVDTANSTVTVGSALIDLALDANVVHTSGNETIAGIKSFSDDTYIKSLNFTSEVASPSSSSSSILPLITTVTYTDQTASKVARINLRNTASGDKSLYPHENNQYALGLTSRKWSEVHATTYYYGSSDVEFSNKFCTLDTAQTITGAKNFSDILTGTALDCARVRSKSDPQAYIVFRQNDQVLPGSIVIRASDGTGTSLHITGGSFRSYTDNTVSLGTSSYKWTNVATNAINGLNPSSLGMPDLNHGIDISGYITHLDKVVNNYTPPANGWLSVRVKKTSLSHISLMLYQTGGLLSTCETTEFGISGTNLPVIANKNVEIYIIADSLVSAKFYPCLGNV